MKLLRVFPKRTNCTPDDEDVRIGMPDPERDTEEALSVYDEIHVSVTFSWDKAIGWQLADAYDRLHRSVHLGGPATWSDVNSFVAGRYLKHGITITSRGCIYDCAHCVVREREGELRPLSDFPEGYIVQDNNLAACPRDHIRRVFSMLRAQRHQAIFRGGISAQLLSSYFLNRLLSIRVGEVWIAADSAAAVPEAIRAVEKLHKIGLSKRKIRCYCMIGYDGESMPEAELRLRTMRDAGCTPFAQLYQEPHAKVFNEYTREWRRFTRSWQRPAAIWAKKRIYLHQQI